MIQTSQYDFWVKLASRAAVVTALTLVIIKMAAWMYSGSASMLASLTDSFADGLASLVNFVAIRYAIVPADHDHRYGHGKAEPLAALAQSAFILGSAFLLLFHGGERLINPAPINHVILGVIVSIIAIILTFALVLLQKKAVAVTSSTVIEADELHYKSDLFLNAAVLLALVGAVMYVVAKGCANAWETSAPVTKWILDNVDAAEIDALPSELVTLGVQLLGQSEFEAVMSNSVSLTGSMQGTPT